jgi:PTH1 family peptidyl-tRNA hydrolase
MFLLVGLGNPGPKYAGHRHNIGFMVLDEIARRHGLGPWRRRFQGLVAEGRVAGHKVLALKPATFMNRSGQAVGEALRFYKLEPDQVTVFYDETPTSAGTTGGCAWGWAIPATRTWCTATCCATSLRPRAPGWSTSW